MGGLKFLLDTNVWSELIRPRPNERVRRHLLEQEGRIATAAPVVDELEFGIARLAAGERKSRLYQWLTRLTADHPVLPFDLHCARWHGRERARRTTLGKPAPFTDGQIAAIAVVNDLVLATRNRGDFREFPGLEIANWF